MGRLATYIGRVLGVALLLALPTVSIAENATPPRVTPALWRVHSVTSTVYLFGSLHILPPAYHWTTPEIERAMSTSDLFIFEVPIDEAALQDQKAFIVEHGLLPPHQSLRGYLTANEFQTYSAVLRRAGLKPEFFEHYRPWLAAVMVGLAYLHRDDLVTLKGADDELMAYARDHGKKSIFLESIREQMQLLTAGDDNGHIKALKNLLLTLPRSRTQEKELFETWSSGDAKRFATLLDGYFKDRPEAKEFLVDRRNRDWLGPLKQALARPEGTAMMTVGAAHIGGENGLLALLCGEGYDVERVADSGAAAAKVCGAGA
ncbi:MAG TPA: TraB/GumN family protein [Micropepsaceae bacterium]|nr:TraB/GumN family protein [Micropepsaceae bacterium]